MLTAFGVGRLKAKDKDYLAADSDGLYLMVRSSGRKSWLVRTWRNGKEQRVTLGQYPAMSLIEARRKRDEVKARVKSGLAAVAIGEGLTFADAAKEWLEMKQKDVTPHYFDNITKRLECYVLPEIGSITLKGIQRADASAAVLAVVPRSSARVARVCAAHICSIMDYAVERGYIEYHVLSRLARTLPKVISGHRPHVTEEADFAEILRRIDALSSPVDRTAFRIISMCFPRVGELLMARWSDIDFAKALWTIPAANTKKRRDHLVPLPRQAVQVLSHLRSYEEATLYRGRHDIARLPVCPSFRQAAAFGIRPITQSWLITILRRWYRDGAPEMSVHGFRHTASTFLHAHGENTLWIEKQLAHLDPNKIRAVYNRYEFLEERRAMLQRYADWIDTLR